MKYPLTIFILLFSTLTFANSAKELAWIRVSKEAIQQKLKDPSSAQFKNVFFNRALNNTPVVCGEVNSKNSFGGYAGFQRFVAAGSQFAYLENELSGDFGDVWEQLCIKA